MKKLEILDLAINKVQKIEGLDAVADTLEELWINGNQISDFGDIEYMGKTLKCCKNLYIANNPVYSRSNEFTKKIREVVPCLEQLEGHPFDRPVYFYTPPAEGSIFKKNIGPKAQAILADIIGMQKANDYAKEQAMLQKEREQEDAEKKDEK